MRKLALVLGIMAVVCFVASAYAQAPAQAPAKVPAVPVVIVTITGVVDSVNVAESKVVVDEGVKKFTTLIVEKTTIITLADGKLGRLDELKKGEKVEVQDKGGVAVSIKVLPAIPATK